VGSGFALDRHTVVTNRHVLAGAEEPEVSTWDGQTLEVVDARVATVPDLAVATVSGALPGVVRLGRPARPGDDLTVVGYPLGGPLTLRSGMAVDTVSGARYGIPGGVLRLDVDVQPGNSGGPVLDARGRLVAIVFARDAAGNGLAVPVGALRKLIAGRASSHGLGATSCTP